MRWVAPFAAALAVVAPASGTTGSGLYGKVTRGPVMPVCVAEKPCSGPAAGVKLEFLRNGSAVARAITAKDGTYRVALRAGVYLVRVVARPATGRGLRPSSARVQAHTWSRSNFSLDTGIR
jgi:hypothetical protein